jgi:uncharacterized protein (DUF58 family)
MRSVAGIALAVSSAFLALVAVLLGSGSLFYMATAMIATIAASRVQAWLAVRGLRFERIAPESVTAGDLVTVELIVWSERKLRRPLVSVVDHLPKEMYPGERSPSLPIAPAFDQPIRTQYRFRPMRRGHYIWSGLTVNGTDALGLVTMSKNYHTDEAEITVLPRPIPTAIELPHAAAWGTNEVESGRSRGAGIEPRGVREYVAGDPLRHIHWRSTARTGQLLVKEFEAGSHAPAAFVLQRTLGTDIGEGPVTTFELMCGHVAYLSDWLLRQGLVVEFPTVEDRVTGVSHMERHKEILELLARMAPHSKSTTSEELRVCCQRESGRAVIYVLLSAQDPDLPDAIRDAVTERNQVVALLYDPGSFLTARRGRIASPTEGAYIGRLEEAGASTIVMPLEGLA